MTTIMTEKTKASDIQIAIHWAKHLRFVEDNQADPSWCDHVPEAAFP